MTKHITPSLAGDGRHMLTHRLRDLHGSTPSECKRSTARKLIEFFQESGRSTHSGRGGLLWVVVEWAVLNEVPIRVLISKGDGGETLGYFVERLPAPIPTYVERMADAS